MAGMQIQPLETADEDSGDIANNLDTLQFDSALTEEEQSLIYLRKRSHALTVTACAQATALTTYFNEARQIRAQLTKPDNRRASSLLGEASPRDPLMIGIIGCGRLGSHIAHCLLTFGEVNPEDLKISTRRPETLAELQDKGVACISDNALVAKSVHLLILCILPSQLPQVANEIRGHISIRCLVYSFISSVSVMRLKQLLAYSNIIRPEFEWDEQNMNKPWDYTMDVTGTFAVPEIIAKTCPLHVNSEDAIVVVKEKFVEQILYGFINMCTLLRLTREETVNILNAVLLGHTSKTPVKDIFEVTDITKQIPAEHKCFPKIDLSTIANRDTPITHKLKTSKALREAFLERYKNIFQQYLNWKSKALQEARKQIQISFD